MLSVSFDNITKRFERTVAVSDLSLEIMTGELFFMLGPSGCGKTTCLRMVAGFAQPDGGQLRFGERVMNNVAPHQRNTGMVFQNYALWPHLTVKGNVEYGLRVRKVDNASREKRVNDALEMVRLGHLGDRYPSQLSGGQQQRVALARALVIRPDVLLLDEPLSNLDAQLRLEMRREIKRLHEETGTTALYVTHDQEEALSIADRIAVLRDGVLQQVGTPRELYRAPVTRFVAEFIGETNFLPGLIESTEAQFLTVATPAGMLRATRPESDSFEKGQTVWCSIRPEAWRVNGEATNNSLAAQLKSVMYLGEREQYQAHLTGQQNSGKTAEGAAGENENAWRDIKIAITNPGETAPSVGGPLSLSCDPSDVVVLKN
ncbi:MAG TPA: ABC transporter ATP-binding protein [Abditibacteriaceae bacterium]|jgi:iron(III) transport system ATP-binding protein